MIYLMVLSLFKLTYDALPTIKAPTHQVYFTTPWNGSCNAVVVAKDKVYTALHCVRPVGTHPVKKFKVRLRGIGDNVFSNPKIVSTGINIPMHVGGGYMRWFNDNIVEYTLEKEIDVIPVQAAVFSGFGRVVMECHQVTGRYTKENMVSQAMIMFGDIIVSKSTTIERGCSGGGIYENGKLVGILSLMSMSRTNNDRYSTHLPITKERK